MKLIVTGGAGFIGSHLVDALIADGHRVLIIDDLSTGVAANLNPAAEFHQLDIRTPAAAGLVRAWAPAALFHLAAQMSVSRSMREPVFDAEVNVMGTLNLLDSLRGSGCHVIFASTGGALYGDAGPIPTPEAEPPWPVSAYGVAKLAVERYLHAFEAEGSIAGTSLRYANVYGPRQNPHGEAGVVAIFCRALFGGRIPTINGDGLQTRDYVHVADVVAANLAALRARPRGSFNIGTGVQTNVNDLFQMIAAAAGREIQALHGPARPGEQRTSALAAEAAGAAMGWSPRTSLSEGLASTVEWFRTAG